jgi:hypothetical protein
MRAAAAVSGLLALAAGCGPWATPAAPQTASLDVPVTAGSIWEHGARFTLGAPLAGEVVFDLPRCEFAGTGAMRIDRACVGTFVLRTPRGALSGGARALWSGYRQLLALAGTVRVGTGCFAGATGGEVTRDGPVSFPKLPLRLAVTLPAGSACLPAAAPDERALVRAAHAADPAASAAALEALARALATGSDDVREAAAVAVGFAAADAVYAVFRDVLRGTPALLGQAEKTRELRSLGPAPSRCDAGEPDEPELAAMCAAAARGLEAALPTLAAALGSPSRNLRREAALQLVRLGGARARPVLESAARRALAAGDLAAAVDLAEALLLSPAR